MAHKMLPTKKMHKIEFVNHAKEQSISDSEVTQFKSEYFCMYVRTPATLKLTYVVGFTITMRLFVLIRMEYEP